MYAVSVLHGDGDVHVHVCPSNKYQRNDQDKFANLGILELTSLCS